MQDAYDTGSALQLWPFLCGVQYKKLRIWVEFPATPIVC